MKIITREKIKLYLFTIGAIAIGIFATSLFFDTTAKSMEGEKISIKNEINENIELSSEKTGSENLYFFRDKNKFPKLSAEAYIAGDLETGEIILAKNKDKLFPIASVSKVMTATVARKLTGENDTAVISKSVLNTYGQNGNFYLGEKIKVNDLLYPLLLESSNDAGEAIAQYFDKDIFMRKMNQFAKNIDMKDTKFDDPSGLSRENVSTVSDLFKLTGYIHKNDPELFSITQKRNFKNNRHNWFSNNQFLREEGYIGGKSGYTDPAKQTVVSLFSLPLAENSERKISIALLQSKNRYDDVKKMVEYLKKNVYYGGKKDANTDWVKQKGEIFDIKDTDFVTMAFGGDLMLDRGVRNSVNKNFNGDYSALFENLNLLKKYDIVFANLEGPASDTGKDLKNLYSFRMDPSVIPALKGAGFSILSVANNHVGDWGKDAYEDTLKRLEENEILYTGGGKNATEAESPVVFERYGMKIGFLGFSDVGPNWMEATLPKPGFGKPEPDQAGILLANNPRFEEIIQNASSKVDYLVVSFHFGDEYKTLHNERQEYLAHKAIDSGAKIVVGHHPHVAQDTEVYKNGFIAYSLGNLIFDQGFSENTMQGSLLEIKLWRNGDIYFKNHTVKLNKLFQPEKVVMGKEEKIEFEDKI